MSVQNMGEYLHTTSPTGFPVGGTNPVGLALAVLNDSFLQTSSPMSVAASIPSAVQVGWSAERTLASYDVP